MPENLTRNSTILAAALMEGSTDYQQLADAASQGRVSEIIEAVKNPGGARLFQDITGLLTTIGRTRIHSQRFEDPLAFLEGSYMSYGANVREIAVKWAKAHSYASDSQTLLKRCLPKFLEAFHQIDRAEKYCASVSITEFLQSLQPGIGGDDGTGLDTLLGAIFDSMYSPEAYNSMNYTLQTIAEADNSWADLVGRNSAGALHRRRVPEIVDKDTGAEFMQTVEELALTWRFPSTIYNNMPGLPVFTDADDIVILVRPSTLARIDMQTLANVFHETRMEDIRRRIVVVPGFALPGVRAVIADRNFFVIHRSYFGLESFYNPDQLTTKYILHSQGVWSASPIPNIALLGDFADSDIVVINVRPATLTLTPEKTTVEVGGKVGIRADLNGTVTASADGSTGCVCVKPDSVTWEISAPEGVTLNRKTYIDRFGVLHVQKSIDPGVALTIKATSTYINPSGETEPIEATTTITTVERDVCDGDSTEENQLAYTDVRDAKLKDDSIEGLGDNPVNP